MPHRLLLGQSPEEIKSRLVHGLSSDQTARWHLYNLSGRLWLIIQQLCQREQQHSMQCGRETNYHAKIPTELPVELTGYFPRVLSSGLMGISVVSLNLVLSGMNRSCVRRQGVMRRALKECAQRRGTQHFFNCVYSILYTRFFMAYKLM